MPKALDPVNDPVQIKVNDQVTLYTVINTQTGIHHIECHRCLEFIPLTKTGNPRSFFSHLGNKNCMRIAKRKGLPMLNTTDGTAAAVTVGQSSPPVRNDTPISASAIHSNPSLSQITISLSNLHASTPPPEVQLSSSLSTPTSSSITTPVEETSSSSCPGKKLSWDVGSVWSSYPYHQHKIHAVGWTPIGFDSKENMLILRADNCEGNTPGYNRGEPCIECRMIEHSSRFKEFMCRAEEAKEHTPWDYLSSEQCQGLMRRMARELNILRTNLKNALQRIQTAESRTTDFKRIMMLIASKDIVGLKRLVAVALRRGCSAAAIVELIEKSVAGLYSPRGGFTDRDLDIGFLVKSIGGPRLLYALSKSHGLASETTIRRHRKIPRLLPAISVPSTAENNKNMSTFLDPNIKPPPPIVAGQIPGTILMIDGVALEPKCRYCPDRNQIMGLCREHAKNVQTEVVDLKSVEDVRTAIFEPSDDSKKVCLGSDATVVALAPYARADHYRAVPLVVSPSDKTEKWEKLAEWVANFLRDYATHPFGEKLNGKIYALASDGDSTFRRAKHEICSKASLDPQSPLGKSLLPLIGLNMRTSIDGMVWTCDPKHIMKRFATLLRSRTGIMINDTNIRPEDIIRHLCEIPGMTTEKALALLDPQDKQNVPKAVSLIQHLLKLKDLEKPQNPTDLHRRNTINFLAHFLGCFVLPFIDVAMSLSDQLTSLVKFAHLAFGLQIQHGSSCLTGALYADTQATIKNIIITTARLQLLSPDLCFYLLLEGTDRLEMLFGDCRTQDHARNFDIDQLSHKLGTATLINAAFERNPDLNRGHRRLNLKDALGVDHINPTSWDGDTTVGLVDLESVWNAGRDAANQVLEEYFGVQARVDYCRLLARPNCDFLQPDPGKYVGIQSTADDLRSEEENLNLRTDLAHILPSSATVPSSSGSAENVEQSSSSTETNSTSPSSSQPPASSVLPDELFSDFLPDINIDDFLPDLNAAPAGTSDPPDPHPKFSKTITVDGKTFLKGSLVASLCSNRSKKVAERTLRVQGIAVEDLRQKSKFRDLGETENFGDEPAMKNTDLGGFLARVNGHICLAVLEVAGFQFSKDKQIRSICKLEDLADATQGISVVGQVVELVETTIVADGSKLWEWTGRYLCLDTTSKSDQLTKSRYVLEVPSILIQPISPYAARGSDARLTWMIKRSQLDTIVDALWMSLKPESNEIITNIFLLPEIKNSTSLPYRLGDSQPNFYIEKLPENVSVKPKLDANDKVSCRLCSKVFTLNKMCPHVGKHLLVSMRGYDESNLISPIDIEPCGFCGLEGNCFTQATQKKDGSMSITSTCEYHYVNMRYSSAASVSNSQPCTNVPIHCPLCLPSVSGAPQTIWKYNTIHHILLHHSSEDPSQPGKYLAPKIPGELMVDMFISKTEERLMGVPAEATESFRKEYDLLGSDDMEGVRDEVERRKRDRATTVTADDHGGKRRRD